MLNAFAHLDWLAVALAAGAYYLLGAVWFTPLFGRAWDRSIGFERPREHRFGVAYFVVPLAGALLVSVAVGIVLGALVPGAHPLVVGGLIGLAVAAVSVNNGLTPHTPRPFLFGAVTGGYHLVGIIVVSAVIGTFGTA